MSKKRLAVDNWFQKFLLYTLFVVFLFLAIEATIGYSCIENNTLDSYTGYCIDIDQSTIRTKTGSGSVYTFILDNGFRLSAQKATLDSNKITDEVLTEISSHQLTFQYCPGLIPWIKTGTLVSILGNSKYHIPSYYAESNLKNWSTLWSICSWLLGISLCVCDIMPSFFRSPLRSKISPKIRKRIKSVKYWVQSERRPKE